MATTPLSPDQLRCTCDPDSFAFATTAELNHTTSIIGQPRGVRAIEFGIAIRSPGYNIFVLGEAGTGRTTAIRRFLREKTRHEPVPDDWVYVHNFQTPSKPRAIEFPAGQGRLFQKRIQQLVAALREDIPRAFDADAYHDEVELVRERTDMKQQLLLRSLEKKAEREGFAIIKTAAGLAAVPLYDGKVMEEATYEQLDFEAQKVLDRVQSRLDDELQETLTLMRRQGDELRKQLRELDQRVAESAITYLFDDLRQTYDGHEEVQLYLQEVVEDVVANLADFQPKANDKQPDLRRFEVNLFVDNADIEGAPVVVEPNPTYYNLIGRIEFEMRLGVMTTHFTNIKPGSLHRANGGYLVIDAHDLGQNVPAWEALKRAIKEQEVDMNPVERFNGGNVLAKTSDPEPIPLSVKIILLGKPSLYYYLFDMEEDFNELFKVKADFSTTMPRNAENEREYARFVAHRCAEENLPHFSSSAVARIVEFGSRMAEHQDKLTARFGEIADLVRESAFWALQNGREVVSCDDVRHALDERRQRSNKTEELIDEDIVNGELFITTTGELIGQINGLSVLEYGDYSFAHPSRISTQTYIGDGVTHLDRDTGMTDRTHNKGTLALNGFLGAKYGREESVSFAATISFDQNYSYLVGDSASSAELYALLSSLGQIPLKQGIAVTGSVNQNGELQPIGAATEKVEGFFRVCSLRGLNGTQGVIIPAANIKNLTLNEEVIRAVTDGTFHIWAVRTVDEGMEILTGLEAGVPDSEGEYPQNTVHGQVLAKLRALTQRKRSGDDDDEDEDDDDDDSDTATESPSPNGLPVAITGEDERSDQIASEEDGGAE